MFYKTGTWFLYFYDIQTKNIDLFRSHHKNTWPVFILLGREPFLNEFNFSPFVRIIEYWGP